MTRLWSQAKGVFYLIMHCNEIFIEIIIKMINLYVFIGK